MRLDKFLSITGTATRTEAKKAISKGEVLLNGTAAKKSDIKIDEEKDTVLYRGEKVIYQKFLYFMLNKPEGVVSASDGGRGEKTVIDLLPEKYRDMGLFPCGRLDIDTVGLMLITNNGTLAHRLLAPKRHVDKKYYFIAAEPLTEAAEERFKNGVVLKDGYECLPADLILDKGRKSGYVVLREGKYHQIKRMLGAENNKVIYLKRVTFGPLSLDTELKEGEYRPLTDAEVASLESAAE